MKSLKDRISALLSVKSIITILLTVTFIVLLLLMDEVPQTFIQIYTVIIAFYFGTQINSTGGKAS